jgi:glutathione S-transferase
MPKYTILSYPNQISIKKALIIAEYGGVSDQISYPQDFKMMQTNLTEEYKKLAPTGYVPALKIEGQEGGLFESNAIARYLARVGNDTEGLLGADAYTQSLIDAWIEFSVHYIQNTVFTLCAWHIGYGAYSEQGFNSAVDKQKSAWTNLEAHLNRNGTIYMINDRVTLSDIVFAVSCVPLVQVALDANFRKEFPKTEIYLRTLYDQDHIKKHVGEIKFLEKFVPPSTL